jgi:hypothetical protein
MVLKSAVSKLTRAKSIPWILAAAAWTVAVCAGTQRLMVYENRSAVPIQVSAEWPRSSRIQPRAGRFTLVLFAHPDCPCTRASLAEIEELLPHETGKLDVVAAFRKPGASEAQTRSSAMWAYAAAIPGILPLFDEDGREAGAFAATVSGQASLFDPQGRLVFRGGLTPTRGMVGDNFGLQAVKQRLKGAEARADAPVFGCSLLDPDADELKKDLLWKKQ